MPKGRSLHIGVNSLDPAGYCYRQYSAEKYKVFTDDGDALTGVEGDQYVVGWKGPLGNPPAGDLGCEKDADDMAEIARRRGFEPRVILKTSDATADNVRSEIEEAARDLEDGDIFFVTYSGHGAQVRDTSRDEAGGKAPGHDETWCLYDRMLLDDEQAALYSDFRPGVRIVALLDSCHSGTATRRMPTRVPASWESDGNVQVRNMPRGVDMAVYEYERNKPVYDEIQDRLARENLERGRKRNLNVISISACLDTQKAKGHKVDGGWFTNAVTAAFGDDFEGSYHRLYERILEELEKAHPDASQEPFFDHALLDTDLEEAIRLRPGDVEAELAAELDARPDDEKAAIRNLSKFLAERPFWISKD